jgi:predicted homoserine dehydrogenase-like protein
MIDNLEVAQSERALAMGLTAGARVTRPVAADTMLTIDDVDLPPDRLVDQLRLEQSEHFGH